MNRIYNQYLRLKNFLRKKKDENKDNKCLQCFSGFYTLYNMFYYALRPFLGASALYFDICKDIVFAILIHESLTALVGNESLSTHPFEAGLIYVLIFSIIVVQVSFYDLLNFFILLCYFSYKTTLCRSMYMCDFKFIFCRCCL